MTTTIGGTPALELVHAIEGMNTRLTEIAALTRGLTLNNVLWAGTLILDADGVGSREFTVPAAALSVFNADEAATLVIVAGTRGEDAPTSGEGVLNIPFGHGAVLPFTGRSLTVYGAAAQAVTLAVYSTPQPPSWA